MSTNAFAALDLTENDLTENVHEPTGILIVPADISNDAASDSDIPNDTASDSDIPDDSASGQEGFASNKDCRHHISKGLVCKFGDECIFRHGKRDPRPVCFDCNKRRVAPGVETCDHCLRVKKERTARRAEAKKRDAKKKKSLSTCHHCQNEKIRVPGGDKRELYCKKCDKLHRCCNTRCDGKMVCRGKREVKCRDCADTHKCSNTPKKCYDLNLEPHRYSCGFCRRCHQAGY